MSPPYSIAEEMKKTAGQAVSRMDRREAPALRSRILRSYVPLRFVPSENASMRDIA